MQIRYSDGELGYRPGQCNIGPQEITRRRRFGITALAAAAILAVVLVAVGAAPWARALVFLPLVGGIVSLEEARRHFCGAFALGGFRSFGARDEIESVVDPGAVSADRRAAAILFLYSAAIAAAITVLFIVAPI